MIIYYSKDNHSGPNAQAVMDSHPEAVRAHYQDSIFPDLVGWRVAYPIECGGGPGLEWVKVDNNGNRIDQ